MCHLVLLAPVLALPVLWLLPLSIAVPAYGTVLVITSLIAWPVVAAMRRRPLNGIEGMIDARGEAITELNPRGLIRCQGELWSATAEELIPAGGRVRVVALDRLSAQVTRYIPDGG